MPSELILSLNMRSWKLKTYKKLKVWQLGGFFKSVLHFSTLSRNFGEFIHARVRVIDITLHNNAILNVARELI